MEILKILTPLALALFAWLSAFAVDPYIAYIYPAGLQAGTTNRFVVGGQGLWGKLSGTVSGKGVDVLSIEIVPGFAPPGTTGQRQHLKKWLDAIAKGDRAEPPLPNDPHITEWRESSWWRKLGELDELQLSLVERDLFIQKNALQMSPSLRQMALVTVAAAPDAEPNMRELVIYGPSSASAPHPIVVTAAPHVAEPLYVPPHRRKGKPLPMRVKLAPSFILDGQIMPGETDRFAFTFEKGQRLCFTLVARELLPYIGDAVPGFFNAVLRLVGPDGDEVAFADDNSFRPDPVMHVEIPRSGDYVLEVRDNLFRGREDFVYMVTCENENGKICGKPSRCDALESGQTRNEILSIDGMVKPGEKCEYELEIKEPCTRVIEVEARALGSSLDPVVSLYAPKGWWPFAKPDLLETWDDKTNTVFVGAIAQAECDPVGYYGFKEPGRYKIVVSDRVGAGGDDYFFHLSVREPSPDFTVYSTRSSFPVRNGLSTKSKFKIIRREGFEGDVKLVDTPELRFVNGVIPAESNEVSIVAVGRSKKPICKTTELYAEGLKDGSPISRKIIPADEVQQAFAWTHLIKSDAFHLVYALWLPPPPREPKWLDIPDKLYADIRRGTNAVPDVAAAASEIEISEAVSRRHLRNRRLVRAGSDTLPSRQRMNELLLAGVTEFDAPGNLPFDDQYARRLMGIVQNAAPDNDVLVYSPTSSLAVAHAEQKRLRDEGFCADMFFRDRMDSLNNSMPYRVMFVPKAITLGTNEIARLVSRMTELGWQLVFEGNPPAGIGYDFEKKGKCRIATLRKGKGRILAGPLLETLSRASARREPFKKETNLRCSRWKDGPETVYFIVNTGDSNVDAKFKPHAKTVSAAMLDPTTGDNEMLKAVRGEIQLSVAKGHAIFLRTYPYVR